MDNYDLVIVGGGPGGYVAAIRAAQLGLETALVEKDKVGGVCLNWGCIPTKSLLRNAEVLSLLRRSHQFGITVDKLEYDFGQAVDRSRRVSGRLVKGIQFLLKKNKVDLVEGEGYLTAEDQIEVRPDGQKLKAKNVILATGARPRSLPGLEIDGEQVLTSRQALELKEVPSSIIIVGGGPIGLEFAYIYQTYGSQVTVVEMLPHLLPLEDVEISELLEKAVAKQGMEVLTNTRVEEIKREKDKVTVIVSSDDEGERKIEGEKVLVAIGVQPNSENLGLESLGVAVERGYIAIDDRMATNVPGLYAIGDVTGKMPLAHVASAQGVVVVEAMVGRETGSLVYENMPRCTYCQPQVASLGLTEAQAKERGYEVKIGRFPFRANGKALALADYEGMVKIVADAEYGEILGAHLIGPEVTDMIAEVGLAKTLEATPLEIGRTVHAHPTLSEALMEAALAAEGEAIHI
ncbi:MAG: dihydrolipoyl dehydrogenase [Anaerolineae bacterium]